MQRVAREWVDKAEADFGTARREFRARKSPNHDDACFHAQQCAEKYLKALLQAAGIRFAKTHNLIALLDQLRPVDPTWELHRPALMRLGAFGVAFRYPGASANRAVAREALALAGAIRAKAREALKLREK